MTSTVSKKALMHRETFTESDHDVLDTVLSEFPEVRLCAIVLKAWRKSGGKYPISNSDQLAKLLPKKEYFIEGRILNEETITRYMKKEFFPIEDDKQLVATCYTAMQMCNEDTKWAAAAPSYATDLLSEQEKLLKLKVVD